MLQFFNTVAGMNPTQMVLEARLQALEGGTDTAIGIPVALAVASGQAAETLAILNLAEVGDHVVASASLYGGTYNLLHYTLPKMGIETTFVEDPDDLEAARVDHPLLDALGRARAARADPLVAAKVRHRRVEKVPKMIPNRSKTLRDTSHSTSSCTRDLLPTLV